MARHGGNVYQAYAGVKWRLAAWHDGRVNSNQRNRNIIVANNRRISISGIGGSSWQHQRHGRRRISVSASSASAAAK